MCTGAEFMMAGTLFQGVSQMAYADTQAQMAKSDAAGERDAAAQQSQRILHATERRRAEARAATAASGARIDEFSLANEQEILAAGETDAAMAILSGDRRARSLETGAKLQKAAGYNALGASLFSAARTGGWKGTKTPDQTDYSATGADIRARR